MDEHHDYLYITYYFVPNGQLDIVDYSYLLNQR
jgi:hypothetical protein